MVWRELGLTGAWKGRIYLELVPSRSPFDKVEILASRFTDGWQYRLQLPSLIDRHRYLGGLVQVVLTEIANRQNTSDRLAEVPTWLCEGVAQHLMASGALELIIQAPRLSQSDRPPFALASGKRENPLEFAHERLTRTGTSMSFEELCWPSLSAYEVLPQKCTGATLSYSCAPLSGFRTGGPTCGISWNLCPGSITGSSLSLAVLKDILNVPSTLKNGGHCSFYSLPVASSARPGRARKACSRSGKRCEFLLKFTKPQMRCLIVPS